MVYILLADGFEEIEGLTPIDYLRRAGISVSSVGITGKHVTGSHNIEVTVDLLPDQVKWEDTDMVVLPGGLKGTQRLEENAFVQDFVAYAIQKDIPVAAICAAPIILGHKGYLKGKRAVCYPGFEAELTGATVETDKIAVCDGNIITGKSAGAASAFSLLALEVLSDRVTCKRVREALCFHD